MFTISNKKTFTAPVVAHVPTDGGRTQKATFTVTFKALSKPEVDELLASARQRAKANDEAMANGGPRSTSSDRELIDEVLVGFGDDLREEDGTPMVFNQSNLDRLCSIWPIEPAIAKSFIDNYVQAPAKN
jgi:Phage tail assembly chaperone